MAWEEDAAMEGEDYVKTMYISYTEVIGSPQGNMPSRKEETSLSLHNATGWTTGPRGWKPQCIPCTRGGVIALPWPEVTVPAENATASPGETVALSFK